MEIRNTQTNQENQRQNLISQNNSQLNEIFYSLQNDFKNIQVELEEKTKTNKKLCEDFQHLFFYLEKEIDSVEKLKYEKDTYAQSNQDLNDEKKNFGQNMLSLNYTKNEYLKELDFLTKQNQILSQQIEEEQNEINELEKERIKYNSLNKEMQLKNSEKLNIIKINDDAVNYFQQQLNNSNIAINKMVNMINDLENYYKNLQSQYEECSQKHKIYENKKFNKDNIYQELINGIKKKESDISDNISELDSMSGEREQLYNYNTKIYNDLDRLQNHIYELGEQNKKLLEKIAKYQKIEEIINNHIKSKKEMNDNLKEDQQFIEKRLGNNLKNYLMPDNQYNNSIYENKTLKKENNLDTTANNKIINTDNKLNDNTEKINENNIDSKSQQLDNINTISIKNINDSNNIFNYNKKDELTQQQNDNNFNEINYNYLFEGQSNKKTDNNYNYLGFQKELELEHDYE